MKIDLYTKVILTGIFACLCLIVLRDVRLNKTAEAQAIDGGGAKQSKRFTVDFSSPKEAVQTFISAGKYQDKAVLSKCFDSNAPGEFDTLRDGTANFHAMMSLRNMCSDAEITGQTIGEDNTSAVVGVNFIYIRKEKLHMRKSGDEWKILDF